MQTQFKFTHRLICTPEINLHTGVYLHVCIFGACELDVSSQGKGTNYRKR